MRILVVIKTNMGAKWLIPQIRAMRARDHEVIVILPSGEGSLTRALSREEVALIPSPVDFSYTRWHAIPSELLALRRTIRKIAPDRIFYHLYASALAARAASIGLGIPRTHMIAGPLYLEHPTIHAVEKVACHLDDRIISGSHYTASRYVQMGYPSALISPLPYGVCTDSFRRSDVAADQDLFTTVMVAYTYAPKAGVMNEQGIKGHDTLIQAWKYFASGKDDVRLLIVGGGFDDAGEMYRQRLVRDFDVSAVGSIEWFDTIEDVRPLYQAANVSVSPSRSENHGAALEASSMGCPCIVSDAGALPETVTQESGWVFPAGDTLALAACLEQAYDEWHAGYLARRGEAARQHCEAHFDSLRSASAVVDVLEAPGLVVAVTEQRGWIADGKAIGLRSLGIVAQLATQQPVAVVFRQGSPKSAGVPLAEGTTPVMTGKTRGGLTAAVTGLARLLTLAFHAKVMLVDQPGPNGARMLPIAWATRTPLVVNVVGDPSESLQKDIVPGVRGFAARCVLGAAQRAATATAAATNYVTSRSLQIKYPPRAHRPSYSSSTGAPVTPFHHHAWPRPGVTVKLITVGSLEQPYKGVSDIISAVALVRASGFKAELTVVGSGRLQKQLEDEARIRLEDGYSFVGQLMPGQLGDALAGADIYVQGSWTEGLARTVIEASLAGLPVVATNVGGTEEIAHHHLLAPTHSPSGLASCILCLLKDQALWDDAISAGLRKALDKVSRSEIDRAMFVQNVASLSAVPKRRNW